MSENPNICLVDNEKRFFIKILLNFCVADGALRQRLISSGGWGTAETATETLRRLDHSWASFWTAEIFTLFYCFNNFILMYFEDLIAILGDCLSIYALEQ